MSAGLAIYDTMRLIPNDVSTVAMGFAASMGQFLLCAGTPGKRFALPHARIMMHQPSAGIRGTAVDIAIQAENLVYTKGSCTGCSRRAPGSPSRPSPTTPTATAGSRRSRRFEYGMVDRIVESVDDVRPARAARKVGL